MSLKSLKASLYIALFVGFIDHLGVGLVYPMFSSMLFDPTHPLLPFETTQAMRGLWLGILFALMPLAEFITAPIWGAYSDSKGRKGPLQLSLCVGFMGYLVAFFGVFFNSLPLLLVSRVLVGCAAGNISIVQATVADVSSNEEKTKNFGLNSMALGLGFTFGPFCSGILSSYSYSTPFLFALSLIVLNIIFTAFFFKETHYRLIKRKLSWHIGLSQMKKAFQMRGLRILFLCSFLNYFGWSYFFEFIPVFLIFRFQFSPADLGIFFGLAGAFYALSAGIFIRPLLNRVRSETLFFAGLFLTAFSIFLIPLIPSLLFLWPVIFLVCYFTSLTSPTSTALVSNSASSSEQGEALGIFSSINAAALAVSPILSGSLVGNHPTLPMWVGGSTMILAGVIYLGSSFRKLFK